MIFIKAFRIITAVLLCAWMVLIFSLSSENSDDSSKTSGGIIRTVISAIYPDYNELNNAEKEEMISSFQHITRKAAHFTIYAVLGALAYLTVISYKNLKIIIRLVISASICLAYAVSDEIHQLYIPGRSGELRDVCIDFSGAILGIFLVFLISRIIRPLKQFSFNKNNDRRNVP